MQMFYRVMKGIYQFAANLLSYIPAKYYCEKRKGELFLKHSVVRRNPVEILIQKCVVPKRSSA